MSKKGNIRALIKWAGKVGFKEAEKKLRKVKGVKDSKRLAGWLKKRAEEEGVLAPEHKYGKRAVKKSIRVLVRVSDLLLK